MPKSPGRPKLPKKEKRKDVFSVRVKPDEADVIWSAIDSSGKKKPVWMREALLEKASRQK